MADGDGATDVVDLSGNGMGVALDVGFESSQLLTIGVVNVDTFGAAGTGLVDDTAAVIAAQAYMTTFGFGGLQFTPGKMYRISPLVLAIPDLVVVADGATIVST